MVCWLKREYWALGGWEVGMTCACGMDSVGACLVCGARLCADHALRGGSTLNASTQSQKFQFPVQQQAFLEALNKPGVICRNCRVNSACRAAGATPQPTVPVLGVGGSQRLRDAVAAYLLGDAVAWQEMASDAALKDALFQDLIHLAREKAERFQTPVEWETWYHVRHYNSPYRWHRGKVLATEEAFHVVDVTVAVGTHYYTLQTMYKNSPQYMNRHGQWKSVDPVPETVKTGLLERLWSGKRRVLRVSWSDKPPQPGLDNVLKRAAELLAPAS